jgi:hypothetical protein
MKESKKGLRPAKSADSSPSGGQAEGDAAMRTTSKSRRKFLGQVAGTAAAVAVSELAVGTKKAAAATKAPNGTYGADSGGRSSGPAAEGVFVPGQAGQALP